MSSVDEIDFEAEAQLDRTIQFPHALSQHALTPTSVFLTGATGFLGAYLLDELLHQTEATVYCLVRASDADTAKQRLVGHLQAYDLWHQALASRIRPVVGDLTQPYLGLSAEQFLHLATQVDVIYHSAGWINTVFPYARLKPTCRACLPISGRRPGAEEAARRKGRSALLCARGLWGLRATSRSFGLAAGFGFPVGMAVFGPDAGDPNEPWAQRVNPGLTLPVSHGG